MSIPCTSMVAHTNIHPSLRYVYHSKWVTSLKSEENRRREYKRKFMINIEWDLRMN